MSKNTPKSRGILKKVLLDQLNVDSKTGGHYIDMVDKYLTMWDMARALEKDFKDNGVKIMTNSGYKINPSIPEFAKTNNQMLRLLSELGMKPIRSEVDDDGSY